MFLRWQAEIRESDNHRQVYSLKNGVTRGKMSEHTGQVAHETKVNGTVQKYQGQHQETRH